MMNYSDRNQKRLKQMLRKINLKSPRLPMLTTIDDDDELFRSKSEEAKTNVEEKQP